MRTSRTALFLLAIACIALCIALPARAATDPPGWGQCNSQDDAQKIAGCTQVLRSGVTDPMKLAVAHNNRGVAYANQGRYQDAVQDFGEAIRLNPTSSGAYNNRAGVYIAEGRFDDAIQELTQSMKLDPTQPDAYFLRGMAYYDKTDCDHAVLDYDQAILQIHNPSAASMYLLDRGWANVCRGALPPALLDLDRAVKIGGDAYRDAVLWRHIVKQRLKLDDGEEFIKAAANFDWSKWPTAVMKYYLGQATADSVLAAAKDKNPRTEKRQVCAARVYLAEYELLQRRPANALEGLQSARIGCSNEGALPGTIASEIRFVSAAAGR